MKNRKAEIATLLMVGTLVVIGVTAVISSLGLNKKQTTGAKAALACPDGEKLCTYLKTGVAGGGTSQACYDPTLKKCSTTKGIISLGTSICSEGIRVCSNGSGKIYYIKDNLYYSDSKCSVSKTLSELCPASSSTSSCAPANCRTTIGNLYYTKNGQYYKSTDTTCSGTVQTITDVCPAPTLTPIPNSVPPVSGGTSVSSGLSNCGSGGNRPCPTDDVSKEYCGEGAPSNPNGQKYLEFACCVADNPWGGSKMRFRSYGCTGQPCGNTGINNTNIGGTGKLQECPAGFEFLVSSTGEEGGQYYDRDAPLNATPTPINTTPQANVDCGTLGTAYLHTCKDYCKVTERLNGGNDVVYYSTSTVDSAEYWTDETCATPFDPNTSTCGCGTTSIAPVSNCDPNGNESLNCTDYCNAKGITTGIKNPNTIFIRSGVGEPNVEYYTNDNKCTTKFDPVVTCGCSGGAVQPPSGDCANRSITNELACSKPCGTSSNGLNYYSYIKNHDPPFVKNDCTTEITPNGDSGTMKIVDYCGCGTASSVLDDATLPVQPIPTPDSGATYYGWNGPRYSYYNCIAAPHSDNYLSAPNCDSTSVYKYGLITNWWGDPYTRGYYCCQTKQK